MEVDAAWSARPGSRSWDPTARRDFEVDPFGTSHHKGLNVAGIEPRQRHRADVGRRCPSRREAKVRIYDAATGKAVRSFLAYSRYRPGRRVARHRRDSTAGRIVTAPGRGGSAAGQGLRRASRAGRSSASWRSTARLPQGNRDLGGNVRQRIWVLRSLLRRPGKRQTLTPDVRRHDGCPDRRDCRHKTQGQVDRVGQDSRTTPATKVCCCYPPF